MFRRTLTWRVGVSVGGAVALAATAAVVWLSSAAASPVAHAAKAKAPAIITGIKVTGYPLPAEPTITITGTGFGKEPSNGVSPNNMANCGTGNTGLDYGPDAVWANDASKEDGLYGTTRWGGYVTKTWGDCSGIFIHTWTSTEVVFTLGSRYARDGVSMESGDRICAMIHGALGCLKLS